MMHQQAEEPMSVESSPDAQGGVPQANKKATRCQHCAKYKEAIGGLQTMGKEMEAMKLQMEAMRQQVLQMDAEKQQMQRNIEELNRTNGELIQSSNAFRAQLDAVIKQLGERDTKYEERIHTLESQLSEAKKQLQDQQQNRRTSSGAQHSYESHTSYKKTVPGLCGLANLGHSCYMNAALQCLNSAVLFRDYFLKDCSGQLKATGLVGAYRDLVVKMWREDNYYGLRPEQLASEMNKICDLFDGKSPQDAQEFLSTLLENLHDNIKTAEADPSFITQLFQGKQKSSIHCNGCGENTTKDDPFMFLPLAIPEESKTYTYSVPKWTIQSGLEAISREDTFEENQWCCPHCQRLAKCVRTTEVAEAPVLLIVHLKRFRINWIGKKEKVDTPVDFPLNGLELSTASHQSRYKLFAAINHSGSINGGCYTAFAKHGDKWHRFFDSYVSSANESDIVTPNAYVLFYQRVDHVERVEHPAVIRQSGLCGIPNFGNTCYISAALQCLSSLAKVREHFQAWKGSTEEAALIKALTKVLNNIWSGRGTPGSFEADITYLSSTLGQLYTVKKNSLKFIQSLLEKVHQYEKHTAVGRGTTSSGPKESLMDIFQGSYQSSIQCTKCTSLHGQPRQKSLTCLSVAVPDDPQDGVTLETCIQAVMESSADKEYCSACRTFTPSKRVARILTSPKALMVQLTRFDSDSTEKVNTTVSFQKTISLLPFMAPPLRDEPSYELRAVINHYGTTLADGHYTAYCRHEDKWYHYDDSKVTPIQNFEEVVTPVAYILFYEQQVTTTL